MSLHDRYDFGTTEPEIYRAWIEAGVFEARSGRSERVGGEHEPYTIVMPPPNVTAVLHVGHGLNNTVQDVSSAGREWPARRPCGSQAPTTPASRRRTSSRK